MNNSRKSLALVLLTVLVATGCGDNPDPADPAGADGKSPLAPYLGDRVVVGGSAAGARVVRSRAGGDREPTEDELAKQRRVEDSVARCMAAAGFRYVPVPPESQGKSKFDEAYDLPPDKFAEQYGYGISTIDWKPEEDESNPNTAVRNALSTQAKKAYDKAMHGAAAATGGGVAVEKGKAPPTDLGCRGKAMSEIFGKGIKESADDGKYDSLFEDLQALEKRIATDQRVVAAAKAWSDCMADAGHAGLTDPEKALVKVQDRLGALTGQRRGDGERKARPPSFENVDPAKLAELRKFEIDLAKTDLGCRTKHYDKPYQDVQFELERQFVADHQAQLEQYRDWMAQR